MGNILLIDDERSILETLEMFLAEKKHQVYTADTAEKAMALCCLAMLYARNPEIPGFRLKLGPTQREAVGSLGRLGARIDIEETMQMAAGVRGDDRTR